jgi:hypothetical protein
VSIMKNKFQKRKIFKVSEDDIIEILTDHFAEEYGFETYQSVTLIKGTPEEDLRLIAVIGDYDDNEMDDLDLDKLDQKMDFNRSGLNPENSDDHIYWER